MISRGLTSNERIKLAGSFSVRKQEIKQLLKELNSNKSLTIEKITEMKERKKKLEIEYYLLEK